MEIEENPTLDQSETNWSPKKWEWFLATKTCPDILRIGKLVDSSLPVEDLGPTEHYLIYQHLAGCQFCRKDFSEMIGGAQMSITRQIEEIDEARRVRLQRAQEREDESHLPFITRMKSFMHIL